jgi:NADPH:quinone reductase
MKAAVVYENGGPDVLRYEDVPDPECPDGCVLIDVEAISIEGGDLLARAGSPPPSVPHIVGYLAAGTVIEVGAGVEDRAAGDRVVTLNAAGSHASRRAVPAMSTWPIPDALDAARAACVPVAFGTAQECLFTAGNLQAGQTALIHAGEGGVGMAAIQLAKHAGATVISTASSDQKLERLREFGLDHGINYASENFVERTRELTDGRGADMILDSVGGQNLVDSIGALAYRGTLVSVGVAGRAGSNIEARDLWAQNNALRGVFLGAALLTEYPRVHAMIADLFERVASGGVRVEIARTFPLAEAAAAHGYIESRQAFGRVVMTPWAGALTSPDSARCRPDEKRADPTPSPSAISGRHRATLRRRLRWTSTSVQRAARRTGPSPRSGSHKTPTGPAPVCVTPGCCC